MMPIGGMMICVFVGLRIERKVLKEELTNKGNNHLLLLQYVCVFIKYIAP